MSDFNQLQYPIAEYIDPGLPEYADNPLISALPKIMSPEEAAEVLTKKPLFQSEEINLPGHIRYHAIARLRRDFFTPQTVHISLERKLSQMIRKSYLGRNPKDAIFKRKLNKTRGMLQNSDLTSYVNDAINSTATSTTIAGISGAGKSTATNIILNTYPRKLYHPEYHLLQVPWIKIDCPHEGSLSEFCESFFIALDRRLDTNYRQKYTSGRPTIGKMIADVADLCLIHAIGLVVVDEFQHMSLAKSGGEKKMINFLVTLVNVVEVSVVLIGTPKALTLFTSEFRQARRASGEGCIVWDRLKFDESWEDFLDDLWPYQWLRAPRERDELITNKLYELSQGVPDTVVKLFGIAQAQVILYADSPADEYISVKLLEDIYEEELSIEKLMLTALKTGDKRTIEKCTDLFIPDFEGRLANMFDHIKPRSLRQKRNVELGDASQNDVANGAIETLLSMGVAGDIAESLVTDALRVNPDLTLIQIINFATNAFNETQADTKPKKTKPSTIKTKQEDWGMLPASDWRKIYADKTGTMHDELREKGIIKSFDEFEAG